MKVLSEYVSKMFGRRKANSLCDLSNLELSIGEQFCGVFHNPAYITTEYEGRGKFERRQSRDYRSSILLLRTSN